MNELHKGLRIRRIDISFLVALFAPNGSNKVGKNKNKIVFCVMLTGY